MASAFDEALHAGSDCLKLSGFDFTASNTFQDIVQLVKQNRCPQKLDLSTAKIPTEGFSDLLSAFHSNTTVLDLNLSTNFLCGSNIPCDGSLRTLLQSNKTLQKLDLTGHSLSHELIIDLTQGLQHNATLTELVLYNCFLTEEMASMVVKCATNLRVLDLGSNKDMSPEFLNKRVAALLNSSKNLQSLALDNARAMFAVEAASDLTPFFRALETNTTLKRLSLRLCSLKEPVGEAIIKTLTVNSTLIYLDLEFSGFGLRDRGNQILVDLLPHFKALQQLKLLVRFPSKLVPQLVTVIQENSTLQAFHPLLGSDCKKEQDTIQTVLQRNCRMAESQTLLQVGANVPGAILPKAILHLNQSTSGSTAVFHVLQHWIFECL